MKEVGSNHKRQTIDLVVMLERITTHFSVYAVPFIIIIASVLIMLLQPSPYASVSGKPLPVRTLEALDPLESPHQVLQQLQQRSATTDSVINNKAWVLFTVPHSYDPTLHDIRIGPAPIRNLNCADTRQPDLLNRFDRYSPPKIIPNANLGYTLQLNDLNTPAPILCKVDYAAPNRFGVNIWKSNDIKNASLRFTRNAALLEGAIFTLASFIFIIAISTRSATYALLATWLIGNLRLASIAMGWDHQWFGHFLPIDWLPLLRRLTLAIYFLVSYNLFARLLKHQQQPRLLSHSIKAIHMGGLLLLIGAFVLSGHLFTPLMWLFSLLGIIAGTLLLVSNLHHQPTDTTIRFWQLFMLSGFVCVLVTGFIIAFVGNSSFLATFNSVVVLLIGNLMAVLLVSDRTREERQRRQLAQSRHNATYSNVPIALFTLNQHHEIIQANYSFLRLLGLAKLPEHAHWDHYFPTQQWETVLSRSQQELDNPLKLLDHNAPHSFILSAYATPPSHIEGALLNISAQQQALNDLERAADYDPVTNVLNSRGIEKALALSLEQVAQGQSCIVGYLDLNIVKHVNSAYGHSVGNALLGKVSTLVEEMLRAGQEVGRLNGDEFVLIFNNTSLQEAENCARNIVQQLNANTLYAAKRGFSLHSTIGLVETAAHTLPEDALSAASRACRDARNHKGGVVMYKQDSQELHDHAEELRLFLDLESGISNNLFLEMQPILSLNQPLRFFNFEVLLRVRDSQNELIPTGKIIAAAEESGIITLIDKWVITATLSWLATHQDELQNTHQVNLNISGVSLNDDKFIDELFKILAKYKQVAKLLCVEITEGVALQDLARTRLFMQRLQAKGVRIALDDFGAGYTSFSYLRELPADAIKIDGALIKDMLHKSSNIAIVRTIVELARNLGMQCIAEWVEDVDTLRILHNLGIDHIQGYIVSGSCTPTQILAATDIRELIRSDETLQFIQELSH